MRPEPGAANAMRARLAMDPAPAPLPWLRHYGDVPAHLDYPQRTLYQMVAAAAATIW